jgi:hypothetical protein
MRGHCIYAGVLTENIVRCDGCGQLGSHVMKHVTLINQGRHFALAVRLHGVEACLLPPHHSEQVRDILMSVSDECRVFQPVARVAESDRVKLSSFVSNVECQIVSLGYPRTRRGGFFGCLDRF